MQNEDAFMQAQSRSARRVKLNRGQNWIIRFLPAKMGPDALWFARIAQHWMNKVPITCPRLTAPDFGGDPEAECPVCALADELNESPDEKVADFGYRAKANPLFVTWCIVWEKDGIAQPMSEVLNPYEFRHYRSTWEELKGFYIAGGRKSPNSILDYENGNDFSVNKTAKGMRLDKQDASPIFDSAEPKYAEWLKKIESAMKAPKVVIPTEEQLHVFAAKLQEAANRGGGGEDDVPRGRRQQGSAEDTEFRRPPRGAAPPEDDDVPYDSPPPTRPAPRTAAPAARTAVPATTAPARRAVPPPAPIEEGDPDQDLPPEDEPPVPQPAAKRPAPAAAAPVRRAAPPVEPPVEDDPEPPADPAPRRAAPVAAAPRRPAPAAAAPARRPVQAPAPEEPEPDPSAGEPDPEPEDVPPARLPVTQRRTLAPTARRTAAPEAAVSEPQADDEHEVLPEETVDPAPPATGGIEDEDSPAPTPVARAGGQGAAISARLRKLPAGA